MRRFVGGVNVALTLVLLGAALGAGLGLAGRQVAVLDLAAHFAPFYAVAAVVGLAWALVAGRGPVVALAVLALVASGALILPEVQRDAGPTAAPGVPGEIKVIQFNAGRDNVQDARVADWLVAQNADVVTVTEARKTLRDRLIRQARWKTAGGHGSLIIFTPRRYTNMTRPKQTAPNRVSFINGTYEHVAGPMELVTAHLSWPTDPTIARQILALEGVIAQRPRDRMILTGDLNATPWSAELARMDRSLGLVRRDRAVPTWPAEVLGQKWPFPVLPIDHVYAGPGWATVKVERGPYLGSDHYPLIVTLAPVAPR